MLIYRFRSGRESNQICIDGIQYWSVRDAIMIHEVLHSDRKYVKREGTR